jgi:hypothetical protein
MVAEGGDKHLGFMLKTTERVAVDNAVAVSLESGADRVGGFRALPSP